MRCVMVACSPSSPSASISPDEPQGLEPAELTAGSHGHLSLRPVDAVLLLPTLLFMEVHCFVVGVQCDAHLGSGLTHHFLTSCPTDPRQKQLTLNPALRLSLSLGFDLQNHLQSMSWQLVFILLKRRDFCFMSR